MSLAGLDLRVDDFVFFAVCIVLGALYQAAETGLFAMVDARIKDIVAEARARKSRLGTLLGLWLERPDHILTAIVVGKQSAHIALVLNVAVTLSEGEESLLQRLTVSIPTALLLVVVTVAVELSARAVAKEKAEATVAIIFPVVFVTYVATWPAVWLLTKLSQLFSRMAGGNISRSGPFVTERDIVEMIALGRRTGAIDKVEGRMLASIIELGDTIVREVMVPRTDISTLSVHASYADVMTEVKEEGHSRIPVYDGTLDEIKGFFHTKDLLTREINPERFRLRDHLRPVEFVSEIMRVGELLKIFQLKKTHLAVVVDEFGGTAGIVALEDVLEEIVGPIQDEHDDEEPEIRRLSDSQWVVEGRVSLYDLAEVLGITFPDGGYETLGGFLIARTGRMPRKGDRIGFHGFVFTVAEADERKVSRIEVERTALGTTLPPIDGDSEDTVSSVVPSAPPSEEVSGEVVRPDEHA